MKTERQSELMLRHRARFLRRRCLVGTGFVILLAGYALLAVSPETASEWVLFRVFTGFGLLFVGFAVAILPTLARLTGSEDE